MPVAMRQAISKLYEVARFSQQLRVPLLPIPDFGEPVVPEPLQAPTIPPTLQQ